MKVLLVEDDKRIAAAVKRGLDAEGFAVEVALDGAEGLWHATEYRYDLVVLDLMLPRMSGFEVCRELRSRGIWTPILVLTAKDGVSDQTEALDTGADDYLTKPFSFPVLVSHVRALLRRTSGGVPVPIEVGDLRLDSSRHRCWRGEVEITLTPREFAVLEYLMRRADLVNPKFEILDGVWDYDFEGDPNIVEVYIRRLRRKIDEPFGRHDLETVRGAGYRLGGSGTVESLR
ncbi:response regulator transcription factor [Nocardioides sp. WL0053]|jgi:DNA-binding response OmpR family regulator|uniref:Response regulator transcription factor n=1 Tax=Nocardioides jiangsuensis TaxID=2866161 RepID=A0ABS7RJM3_9ACTN|nr:response regulator transcription factor [Nocardioides jiangsuensis]MBY9075244.1 response regulator transcription factor [Nocardioides jiangsuensis]